MWYALPWLVAGLNRSFLVLLSYTSSGRALTRISDNLFFSAIAFLGVFYGTNLLSPLIETQFDTSILYVLSPYDCLAHVGQ